MRVAKSTIQKWVNALRSGKYSQTQAALQDSTGFCCLGVACDIVISDKKKKKSSNNTLSGEVPEDQPHSPKWLKSINSDFRKKTGIDLVDLNDSGIGDNSFQFDEIADLLELVYIHGALN